MNRCSEEHKSTFQGLIPYSEWRPSKSVTSVALQRIGDFVGGLPISLGINLDINLGKLNRGQRVSIGGMAMRLSSYKKILSGIDPNGIDIRYNFNPLCFKVV